MDEVVSAPASPSEFLTRQFYLWEMRGRGWDVWDEPVQLEPPFRPFLGHFMPPELFSDDGVQESALSKLANRLLGDGGAKPPVIVTEQPVDEEEPGPRWLTPTRELVELQVALPRNFQPSREVFEQCLFSLSYCRSSLAFEVIGTKGGIVAQIVATERDAPQVLAQLKAHFPEAVINRTTRYLQESWCQESEGFTEIREFGLDREFMMPLASAKQMATDPLVGICGALDHLEAGEVGIFQVLFQPPLHPWAASIVRAVTIGKEPFFENAPEFVSLAKQKIARPLFAAVVRVGARSSHEARMWEIIRGLAGALSLFGNGAANELVPLDNDDYPAGYHEEDVLSRCSRRSGMLLNSDELVSLAHLPTAAVRSRKLVRVVTRTKEAPPVATGHGVVLGENVHEGIVTLIKVKPAQRVQHMHVIGASGTGKSTLLLNLICQDMEQGHGVGVFDPHGDLIDQILARVPPERESDVILFDPADEEFPIGFNLLSAHSNVEKNLLASDLVAVFRRLSTSWGDQMNSVLGNAILAFLESSKGGTVADLRRFLLETGFRKEFLRTVQDPDVVYYWEHGFPILKANSVGPLLTRLDSFLRPKAIRYMVGQRTSKIDFGAMLNESKIFLAKLPQGIIGEENAFLLGALLVAKFHQLAISRQEMEAGERRPFYLYLDEFQNFATPSMATILSGVRKYQLGLILAHHELRQLQRSDELASAVLSHPYTRVCFRLGDDDARKLAEGFSFFESSDLQNLGRGEAICRMERADFDFNLRTILPGEVTEQSVKERRTRLRQLSRERYGTPREVVEQELARSRAELTKAPVDPFAERTAKVASPPALEPPEKTVRPAATAGEVKPPPLPPTQPAQAKTAVPSAPGEPAPQGKGGAAHVYLQEMVKQLAEQHGWRAVIEERNADVRLVKGETSIACEILVTTRVSHDLEVIRKRLAAGFTWVAMISADARHLARLEDEAKQSIAPVELQRVQFLKVEELHDLLERVDASQAGGEATVKGYHVKTSYKALSDAEKRARRERLGQAVAKGLTGTGAGGIKCRITKATRDDARGRFEVKGTTEPGAKVSLHRVEGDCKPENAHPVAFGEVVADSAGGFRFGPVSSVPAVIPRVGERILAKVKVRAGEKGKESHSCATVVRGELD